MRSKIFQFYFIIYSLFLLVFTVFTKPPEMMIDFRFVDKLEHFAAFSLFSILFIQAFRNITPNIKAVYIISVIAAFIFGLNIEILQIFTGRQFDLYDLAADLTGGVSGVFIHRFLIKKLN